MEIVSRMGLFASNLWMDRMLNRGDTPEIVRVRAAQLRWA